MSALSETHHNLILIPCTNYAIYFPSTSMYEKKNDSDEWNVLLDSLTTVFSLIDGTNNFRCPFIIDQDSEKMCVESFSWNNQCMQYPSKTRAIIFLLYSCIVCDYINSLLSVISVTEKVRSNSTVCHSSWFPLALVIVWVAFFMLTWTAVIDYSKSTLRSLYFHRFDQCSAFIRLNDSYSSIPERCHCVCVCFCLLFNMLMKNDRWCARTHATIACR